MSNDEQLKIYAEPITSLYYIKLKMPDDLLLKINQDIDYLILNKEEFQKWNKKLAGNIEEEYKLSDETFSLLENFFIEVAQNYFLVLEDETLNPTKKWDHAEGFFDKQVSYTLESLWVNLQKKYEFNPIHTHSGDYSFVIWIRIPYNLEDELNLHNSKNANQPCNSLFEFHFLATSGDIQSLPLKVDKNWEGTMVMFPSWLNHSVYPFYTSDDYRISISGNINVNIGDT
jgi:hypothetical protein